MTSSYDAAAHTVTFVFSGSMDSAQSAAEADAVAAALARAAAEEPGGLGKPLRAVFDLQAVDFVSSAFFRICLGAAKQVRRGNFAVVKARPEVTQLFKIAGLDDFLAAL